MAFASSGEDVGRGTFSHRHAVLHDQNREKWDDGHVDSAAAHEGRSSPISRSSTRCSPRKRCSLRIRYSTSEPNQLVIWEAQFGDFANGAQVVIDQFIARGEVKWGAICGLVLLLPHGYEGQGPEHSSARPERYLQLCAQHNMQVCVPSTPAQIFHLLRRQMVRDYRKPLIVMSPKSLLRHKEAVSTLERSRRRRIPDGHPRRREARSEKGAARDRLSGKVYYELAAYRRERKIADMAILRLEQQYPFPHDAYRTEVGRYATRPKSSGARKNRRTREHGIGCVRCFARTSTRRKSSRTPGARCPRRLPSATPRSISPSRRS
jgi:2-oxoglutarate dehydrogenase E1 component